MNIVKKFSFYFLLALSLHLSILILFGISFIDEAQETQVKPLPEIIQASILDEEKIQQEAQRLKDNEKNKRLMQQKKQAEAQNKLKKEQQRLREVKEKRAQEEKKARELEKKAQELEKKTQALALKEKQQKEKLKQQQIIEAARQAKIKAQQQAEEKKRKQEQLAKEKKRKQEQLAKEKKQQALLAKQKAEAAQKKALLAKQAEARKAMAEQQKQASITAKHAIQQKVINRWIKPLTSVKGMSCQVRVKLLPSGDVMDVSIIKSSGDSIFDRSAENAVRKASPLPVPKSRALFSKEFRLFTFNFKPEKTDHP